LHELGGPDPGFARRYARLQNTASTPADLDALSWKGRARYFAQRLPFCLTGSFDAGDSRIFLTTRRNDPDTRRAAQPTTDPPPPPVEHRQTVRSRPVVRSNPNDTALARKKQQQQSNTASSRKRRKTPAPKEGTKPVSRSGFHGFKGSLLSDDSTPPGWFCVRKREKAGCWVSSEYRLCFCFFYPRAGQQPQL